VTRKIHKQILVDETNYFKLKDLGKAGDSFNDVITQILKNNGTGRTKKPHPASVDTTNLGLERRHSSDGMS
jgi:hypothetical protein